MHELFAPRLVNEPFGDPGLLVEFRDARRALLFDLGDLGRLMPRELMRISHAFVTHTHMDHFAGFDRLLRVILGRKAGLVLVGGPDFIAQVEHKLRAYTWNVAHRYEVELVIEAHELGPGGTRAAARFSSRRRFVREDAADDGAKFTGVVHDEPTFRVRAAFVDHEIPCLAYLLEEKARVRVAKERLPAVGLTTGAWLRELRQAVLGGSPDATPLAVRWRDRDGDHAAVRTVGELRHLVLDVIPGRRVGYVTDLRYTPDNLETLVGLMNGVDLLFIESVFLDVDRAHGERKHHLTARQAGLIAQRLGARAVVPFHFSPRYAGRAAELAAELQAAWAGR